MKRKIINYFSKKDNINLLVNILRIAYYSIRIFKEFNE